MEIIFAQLAGTCSVGEYINVQCSGYTNTVCVACTPCEPSRVTVTPCPGNGTQDSAVCMDRPVNCTPPAHCIKTDCWPSDHDVEIQCKQCEAGYWVNSTSLRCEQCGSCPEGQYMSYPCEGYTNTVCSPCYSTGCGPCQVGWSLALNGKCTPLNCLLYGCGASNIGVVCAEADEKHYVCKCPGEGAITLAVGDVFIGCNIPAATDEEVLAQVNITGLAAHLTNGVIDLLGVIVVDVNGNTFTLNIQASVPIDTIGEHLKEKIAEFLGADYTANDITLEYLTKRAVSGTVMVTVNRGDSSLASRVTYSAFLLFCLMLKTVF